MLLLGVDHGRRSVEICVQNSALKKNSVVAEAYTFGTGNLGPLTSLPLVSKDLSNSRFYFRLSSHYTFTQIRATTLRTIELANSHMAMAMNRYFSTTM